MRSASGRGPAAAALLLLTAAPVAASISAQARAEIMRAEARRAGRRYGTGSTALARGRALAVRYRGLFPVRTLELVPDPDGTPAWAVHSFLLAANGRALTSPGVLELDLARLDLPRGTFRDPLEVIEAYQLLRDGRWMQMPPTDRTLGTRSLRVHRSAWGTGRFALAYRLRQPPALLELERSLGRDAPEVVFIHGVDGGLYDYSGPRDVLQLASCVGSRVYFFQYPSGRPVASNALALRRALARRRQEGDMEPGRRRIVIAYSMGGLVARYALQRLELPVDFTDLVLLAVPSRGAELLDVLEWIPFLGHQGRKVLELWPGIGDIVPRARFLEALNDPHAPALPVRTLSLAGIADGNGDLVVDADSADVPTAVRPAEYRVHHASGFMDLNRFSHWGVHQELMTNGLGAVALEWLGLEGGCRQGGQERRWARIRARLSGLAR